MLPIAAINGIVGWEQVSMQPALNVGEKLGFRWTNRRDEGRRETRMEIRPGKQLHHESGIIILIFESYHFNCKTRPTNLFYNGLI
jgi:hypothetical protein